MDKVYVVFGQTGEYSDRTEWPVVAGPSEDAAKALIEELDEWCRENKVHAGTPTLADDYHDLECPFDPAFVCYYTGVSYYYVEVPFKEVP